MTHSIPYYIREQLREDRSVYLPGVGLFALMQEAADFAEGKSVLRPPSLSLSFSERDGDSTPLVERISIVENLSEEKAEKKLRKYAERLFNKLINLNRVDIEGIGTLEKTNTDRILFSDTVASLTDEFHGLQSLRLNPIQHMANSDSGFNPPKNEPATDIVVDSTTSRPWWIPIAGGLLLALIYVMTQKSCDGNAATLWGDASDNIEETETKHSQEAIADAVIDDTDTSNNLGAGMELQDAQENSEPDSEVLEDAEEIAKESLGKIEETLDDEELQEEKTTTSTSPASYSSTNVVDKGSSEIKSVSYDGSTCIIIVGAFGKASNTLRMMERVENLGYQVYTSEYNGLTRVGLQFSCRAEDLDRYIAEARNRLESKAWYLQSPTR